MTDRVLVFNRFGYILDEINANITRAWSSSRTIGVSKGYFRMALNDSKATRRNLEYNNIVYVQSDIVRDWAGVIWPDMRISGGEIEVTLRAAEWMIGQRISGSNNILTGKAHEIFIEILRLAQRSGGLLLSQDYSNISYVNFETELELHYDNLYDAANDLAEQSEMYWFLDPVIENKFIKFRPRFKRRIGILRNEPLVEGSNFIVDTIKETAELANTITAYGKFSDWSNPISQTANNPIGVSKYGVVADAIPFPEVTQLSALLESAETAVNDRYLPLLQIEGIITQAPYPSAGDWLQVYLESMPAILSDRGNVLTMRVNSCAYDPDDGGLSVVLLESRTQ